MSEKFRKFCCVPLPMVILLSACATVSSVAPDTTGVAGPFAFASPPSTEKQTAPKSEDGNSGLDSASDKAPPPYTVERKMLGTDVMGGLSYFMPKQLLKITISETKIDSAKGLKEFGKQAVALGDLNSKIEPLTALRKKIEWQIKSLPTDFADADAKSELALDFAKAKGEEASVQAEIDDLETKVKTTQAAIVAGATGTTKQFAITAELLPLVADTSRHFVLLPRHNPLRDDELKFTITADGLLSSVDIIATDRTGDIIVELGSLAGTIAGIAPASNRTSVPCPAKIVKIIDPSELSQFVDLNRQLETCFGTRIVPESAITRYDIKQTVFTLNPRAGIYYPTAVPMTLNFELKTDHGWVSLDSKTVSLPQAGPIAYIPATASAFVKTTSNMKFQNGMLTSWDSNRPSELAEIVRVPGRAINASFDALSKVLQLKIDTSGKYKALDIASREALLEAEKSDTIRKCVTAAKAADVETSYCFE